MALFEQRFSWIRWSMMPFNLDLMICEEKVRVTKKSDKLGRDNHGSR